MKAFAVRMTNVLRFRSEAPLRPSSFLSASLLFALASTRVGGDCPAGRWTALAPLPAPRQELAAAALDEKIYAVGGLVGRSNANEIYDLAADRWTVAADLPVGTDHAWAVALDGRLYVGAPGSNRVFAYEPAADTWTDVAPSTYLHGGTAVAAAIGGLIYLAGGAGGTMVGNELEAYDPASNTWTTRAPMSCARNHTAGGAIGGKLYVAGGRPGNQTCLEAYDPATNAWTRKADMPTGRSGIAGGVVGGCLYVFGGEGNPADAAGIFHEIEAYEPATDSWTRLPPMQTGRHGISAAVIGNRIYLPGGATLQGFGATAVNDVYVVDPPALVPRAPVILSNRRRR
jgi:N-acetylneuraminic acid mutarotase